MDVCHVVSTSYVVALKLEVCCWDWGIIVTDGLWDSGGGGAALLGAAHVLTFQNVQTPPAPSPLWVSGRQSEAMELGAQKGPRHGLHQAAEAEGRFRSRAWSGVGFG